MHSLPSLVIIAALLLVGIRRPGVLLGGALFTYQLGSLSDLPWLGSAYVAAAATISAARFVDKKPKLEMQPADLAVLAIVLLSAISVSWSVEPDASAGEAAALFLSVAGMYGIARLLPPDHGKTIRTMVWTVAIVAPIVSILLLEQRETMGWGAQQRLLLQDSTASAVGISQPFPSSMLACSMLLLMRIPAWQKGLLVGALVIVLYTAIASGTRSIFLGYGVGLAVFIVLSLEAIRPSRLLQGGLALTVAICIFLFFGPLDALSQSAGRLLGGGGGLGEDASSLERLSLYNIAWNQFLQNPLLGIGDGALIHFSSVSYPHNIFLEILVEFGLLGLIVFLIWFVTLFRDAAFIRAREPETGAILLGFFATVFTQHQVSFSIAMARTLFLVAAVFAAYASSYRIAARRSRRPRPIPFRRMQLQRQALRPGT